MLVENIEFGSDTTKLVVTLLASIMTILSFLIAVSMCCTFGPLKVSLKVSLTESLTVSLL